MRLLLRFAGAGCMLCLLILVARDTSSDSEEAGRVWVGERVLANKVDHLKPLSVPSNVGSAGVEGVVVCSLLIDKEGRVTDVTVLQSPHPGLMDTLPAALRSWTFSKTTVRGRPVPLTGKVVRYLVREGGASHLLAPEEMKPAAKTRVFPATNLTGTQLVDIRDRSLYGRDPTSGSVNIPLDELQVRGPVELSSERAVAIECTGVSGQACRAARAYLLDEGFTNVELLGTEVACGDCR